jgi:ABC-type branched-subunit amino acid transport system permease subunit
VILAQSTMLVRSIGNALHNQALATVDLSLWRWFFFGLTLIVVMVLRPEGLFPSKARRAELLGVEAETRRGGDAETGREGAEEVA